MFLPLISSLYGLLLRMLELTSPLPSLLQIPWTMISLLNKMTDTKGKGRADTIAAAVQEHLSKYSKPIHPAAKDTSEKEETEISYRPWELPAWRRNVDGPSAPPRTREEPIPLPPLRTHSTIFFPYDVIILKDFLSETEQRQLWALTNDYMKNKDEKVENWRNRVLGRNNKKGKELIAFGDALSKRVQECLSDSWRDSYVSRWHPGKEGWKPTTVDTTPYSRPDDQWHHGAGSWTQPWSLNVSLGGAAKFCFKSTSDHNRGYAPIMTTLKSGDVCIFHYYHLWGVEQLPRNPPALAFWKARDGFRDVRECVVHFF